MKGGEPLHVLGIADNVLGGIDWYRLMTPLSALPDAGAFACALVPVSLLRQEHYDWADVMVWSRAYPNTKEGIEYLRSWATERGKVLVVDLSDDHWSGDESNVFYREGGDVPPLPGMWNPIRQAMPMIEYAIQVCDLVTCPTEVIALRVQQRFGRQATVLPNCVNPNDWNLAKEAVRTVPGLTVGVHGGQSHYEDWKILAEVFPVIADRYPDVTLVVAGWTPDYLEALDCADRIEFLSGVPIAEFPKLVANLDIGLCPLPDTPFNRAKSPIKLFENAMAGAASVCSPTVYNSVEKAGAFLADTTERWINGISELINDPAFRKRSADSDRRTVLRDHSIAGQAYRWTKAYTEAVRKARRPKLTVVNGPGLILPPGYKEGDFQA